MSWPSGPRSARRACSSCARKFSSVRCSPRSAAPARSSLPPGRRTGCDPSSPTAAARRFEFPLDWRVLGFALAASTLTIVMCGLGPVLFTGRLNTNETLKAGGRGATSGRGHQRLRHALIVGQFTLAMTLLAGAGFFVRGAGLPASRPLRVERRQRRPGRDLDALVARSQRRQRSSPFTSGCSMRSRLLPGVTAASVSYGLALRRAPGGWPLRRRRPRSVSDGRTAGQVERHHVRVFRGHRDAAPRRQVFHRCRYGRSARRRDHQRRDGANALSGWQCGSGARIRDASADAPAWMEIVGVVGDVGSIDVETTAREL